MDTNKIEAIHGGDIYRNTVKYDFSISINPLGIPKEVKDALYHGIQRADTYPDLSSDELIGAISKMVSVPGENILVGNGASELFLGMMHAIQPQKVVIPVPSFYGYEYACQAVGTQIRFYTTEADHQFCMTEDILSVLTEDVDVLMIANPNNPTGQRIDHELLHRIMEQCKNNGILLVLDECFLDFCDSSHSVDACMTYPNVIIVRSFTKMFAIPGVRLGYACCSDTALIDTIKKHLPEWNISCFAQMAGPVCVGQQEFVRQTVDYVKHEREFLKAGLTDLGYRVFDSEVNFLLFVSEEDVYKRLKARNILIRDCSNYRGLTKGYYRVAVKNRQENEILLKALGERD